MIDPTVPPLIGDPSDPKAIGVHLHYIASAMNNVTGKIDELGKTTSAILIEIAKLPAIYASSLVVEALAKRVDTLEAERDRAMGAMRVAWMVWGASIALLGLAIAAKGKVW